MKKIGIEKLWKILTYIICLGVFLGVAIPAMAANSSMSSNNHSLSSNNYSMSSNNSRRLAVNSVVEPRSSSGKMYLKVDGITSGADLSGTYVIANVENNKNNWAAMSAREDKIEIFKNGNKTGTYDCLKPDSLDNNKFIDNKKYITGIELTEWTFERVEDNSYYISTYVDGAKKYLKIATRDDDKGEIHVTLEPATTATTVNVNVSGGKISISHSKVEQCRLDWYGGGADNKKVFAAFRGPNPSDNNYFTLYAVPKTYYKVKDIVKNKDLTGTYVIANVETQKDEGYYAAMSSGQTSNYRLEANDIEKYLIDDKECIKDAVLTEWTFERVEKNSYYISTKVNGVKKYLKLSKGAVKEEFNIELVNEKIEVNVNVNTDGRISISNKDDEKCRLDWYGGSTSTKHVFGGWCDETPSNNNYFTLYGFGKTYQRVSDITSDTDLSGTYAIANVGNARNHYAAVSSRQLNAILEADNIKKHLTDNKEYITGIELTEWTFEKAEEGENFYYISTNVKDGTKYLTISTREDKGEVDIDLVPEEQKTALKVFVHTDKENRISISNTGDKNCKLDWYGGEKTKTDVFFGGWNKDWLNDNNCHILYRVGTELDPVLYYDVNLPTESIMGVKLKNGYGEGSWKEQEVISALADEQIISTPNELLWLETSDEEDVYFTYEKKSSGQSQDIIDMLKEYNKSSGKDFRFDGWSVTVGEKEYLFDQTAKAFLKDHMIQIEDDKQSVTVPYGTKLTGKWTQVSDIIAFYINENGSVLDTEREVARREVDQFTNALAVGRVYFKDGIVSDNHEIVGKEDTYGKDADEEICSFIDKTTEKINIVLEYVIDEEGNFKAIDKYQAKNLEEDILEYFKNKQKDITICSPFTNEDIHLNPVNCNTDHYGTRWYVLKEDISDFVHIDGVLEAKTVQMKIIKTFYGLDEATVDSLESDFHISSEIRDNKLRSYHAYASLHTNSEDNALYSYQREDTSFIWNVNLLKGEVYNFKENNYKAEDCIATSVEITNRDGVKRTVRLNENESLTGIDTSVVEEIHFRNHYGSGKLFIVKTDEQNANKKLENAEFTLTPEGATDANAVVGISDADGIVCFDDLQLDMTYLLKETKAPDGYQKTENTWTVKVLLQEISTDDGAVKESVVVKIFDNSKNGDEGTICYSYDEIVEYEISNTPETKDDGGSGQPPENEPTDDKKPTGNKKPTGGKKPSSEQKPIVEQKPTDEQKPAENKGGIIPTGDSAKTMLMCGLLVCSIVALCVMGYFKRKK